MKLFASIAIALSLLFSQGVVAKDKVERPVLKQQSQQKVAKVNINTADASQLAAVLKGIGLKKAKAIIEYREKFGPFKSIDELTAVKGVGAKTIEKNRLKISI